MNNSWGQASLSTTTTILSSIDISMYNQAMLNIMIFPDKVMLAADSYLDELQVLKGAMPSPSIINCWHDSVLVGYEGVSEIAGMKTEEWLEDFMFQYYSLKTLGETAEILQEELQAQRIKDEGVDEAEALLVYLVGYEETAKGNKNLKLFCLRNWTEPTTISKYFQVCDELTKGVFRDIKDVPSYLTQKLQEGNPVWLRDGLALPQIKALDTQFNPLFNAYKDNNDSWADYLRLAVVCYGAVLSASENKIFSGVQLQELVSS